MKVIIFGGDGFCGWPSALELSSHDHEVTIVDNFVRRRIDNELGVQSLTPIRSLDERRKAWSGLTGRAIDAVDLDLAGDYAALTELLARVRPEAVVHFAEQRAAPYSMKSPSHKRYTVDNNVNATHNLLAALVELGLDTHVVHLGTMGVYGYDTAPIDLPEGYFDVSFVDRNGDTHAREILYPTKPGSVYHLTKSLDQLLFEFYARNDDLRITDLHQGIVWGTQTTQTRLDERLINRFDYDGDFGTVLNRFLVQAALGTPLTVHGTGGQTRAFINLQDSVRCVRLAVESGADVTGRVRVMNQITETHCVRDLAHLVSRVTGAEIAEVANPRNEADVNELSARNSRLLALGLDPILLETGLLEESLDIAKKYADRADLSRIPCVSYWNDARRALASAR
ncbi:NAD-dependent epimerase/dehydratase family protein [Mycolicibacterium sp. OfavD-34-C]|jgi:UDP-sulfoquinovose synthase|uniref:NAD-dependent epimerase/dehydratase family protein n=1 Tax=Mycolicibacterium sp. OfavD-34-C TaxID=2917746 RepID=UPI001EF47D66|nr:NAD-dependent epimerase/dehydratase family protein [Mycolicibacterium sp. OfavD-34-C]MCG7583758.1 NAD-dependent epimerase/dehydratase family protein [Mycolicibacterium sp. OfavD-34-C]